MNIVPLVTVGMLLMATAAEAQTVLQAGQTNAQAGLVIKITSVASGAQCEGLNNVPFRLNEWLTITTDAKLVQNPTVYTLFIDGRAIDGLDETVKCPVGNSLSFHLNRTDVNAAAWKAFLGAPTTATIPVEIGLAQKPAQGTATAPTILSGDPKPNLQVLSGGQVVLVLAWLACLLGVFFWAARSSSLFKDNLIPQLDPKRKTYSLGRSQMAFWTVLVLGCYIAIYLITGDFHTITTQTLWLMGIAGASGLAAAGVDVLKDSPADAANRALEALGLKSYDDVRQLQSKIESKRKMIRDSETPNAEIPLAQAFVADSETLLQAYERAVEPFISQGWFNDLTTDLNGMAIHRVQVLIWTTVLGVVFISSVYANLSMPILDGSLLALLGISNGSYVGFKYPEPQQ